MVEWNNQIVFMISGWGEGKQLEWSAIPTIFSNQKTQVVIRLVVPKDNLHETMTVISFCKKISEISVKVPLFHQFHQF